MQIFRTSLLPGRNTGLLSLQGLALRPTNDSGQAKTSASGIPAPVVDGNILRLSYSPALDGLRALSVIAVLLYHAGLKWVPGGFLGVEVFFVISGYLITSLLLAEWGGKGCIDFKVFWLRRARRLFPALFLLLAVVISCAIVFLPDEVAGLRGDFLSTGLYVNNWFQVFSHKSYFETVGRPSLLKHMWSLAVEEQFYLVWPLVFFLLIRYLRRSLVIFVILAGALTSISSMAALYQPDMDPSRLYYGTDTRAAGLLFGAALAFVRQPGCCEGRAAGWLTETAGLAALGVLAACFLFITEFNTLLYRGGFTFVDITAAGLIAVAVHPCVRFVSALLSWKPLLWVGLRSYGIYLWHFPVFAVTRPDLDVPVKGLPLLVLRLAVTLAIAALSYHFVEKPVRGGALGRAWKRLCEADGFERLMLQRRWTAAVTSAAVVAAVLGFFLLNARPPQPPAYLAFAAPDVVPEETPETAQVPVVESPVTNQPITETGSFELVTAVGDSVMQGVTNELRRTLGEDVIIDAEQGRQAKQALSVIRKLRTDGRINPVVVLHIGANGFFSRAMFDKIMTELKDAKKVIVVNVKVPRNWQDANNAMMADAIRLYPNAELLDWYGASNEHHELFWKDGIHLRPKGARLYAGFIAKAVKAVQQGESLCNIHLFDAEGTLPESGTEVAVLSHGDLRQALVAGRVK